MRPALRSAGVALLLFARSAVATHAADGLDEPVKLVRTLQVVQDQIAHGTLESESARRTLIDTIGARLIAASPETWRDPRNFDAAILYVLSGGNPALLAKLPAGDDASHQQLVAAVRAYATGSEEEARKLWTPIDIHTLSIGLVGPAALAKATLLMDGDPTQAMQFVDIARLEAPGTLIEEAAVRRGIEISAKLGDAQKFESFAIRYASRFPRSMYAEAFRERFSEFYLKIAAGKDDKVAPKLDTILAPLGKDDRREIFLEIARLAIIDAKIALGKSAAENALALSEAGTVEKRRAELYQAAALAVGDDPAEARVKLDAVGEGDLPPRDRELLGAALAVVDQVEHWPETVSSTEPPPVEGLVEASPDGASAAATDVVARARNAVAAARQLLDDAGT
jgi:chemotaxis protein MotC